MVWVRCRRQLNRFRDHDHSGKRTTSEQQVFDARRLAVPTAKGSGCAATAKGGKLSYAKPGVWHRTKRTGAPPGQATTQTRKHIQLSFLRILTVAVSRLEKHYEFFMSVRTPRVSSFHIFHFECYHQAASAGAASLGSHAWLRGSQRSLPTNQSAHVAARVAVNEIGLGLPGTF
jgi:hypothetical protein